MPTKRAILVALACLAISLPAAAKSKSKDLMKDGQSALESGNAELAEDYFCQAAQEDPKNKKAVSKCEELRQKNDQARAADAAFLKQGQALFQQGSYEAAAEQFNKIKTSKYQSAKKEWMDKIAALRQHAREKEEADKQKRSKQEEQSKQAAQQEEKEANFLRQGIDAYDKNNFVESRSLLVMVNGSHKGEAQTYITKIDAYLKAFAEGWKYERDGNYKQALASYRKAESIKRNGPDNVGQRIARVQGIIAKSNSPTPPETPTPPTAPVDEGALVAGIQDFYKGSYDTAEAKLSNYSSPSELRVALAHFYAGASKVTRYYLAGATPDQKSLLDSAVAEFKIARRAGGFSPPPGVVSPKILAVYDGVTP
ncbi:MAG TPA: hypothetical protein VEG30_09225 [Terriglobales bacterium]|nr:hypothetical protein [Terriglobales bacterium]